MCHPRQLRALEQETGTGRQQNADDLLFTGSIPDVPGRTTATATHRLAFVMLAQNDIAVGIDRAEAGISDRRGNLIAQGLYTRVVGTTQDLAIM